MGTGVRFIRRQSRTLFLYYRGRLGRPTRQTGSSAATGPLILDC